MMCCFFSSSTANFFQLHLCKPFNLQIAIRKAMGIERILKSMKDHTAHAGVAQQACFVYRNLAGGNDANKVACSELLVDYTICCFVFFVEIEWCVSICTLYCFCMIVMSLLHGSLVFKTCYNDIMYAQRDLYRMLSYRTPCVRPDALNKSSNH